MDASYCLTCKIRNSCKEICPELEKTLPKDYTGKNTRREFLVGDTEALDRIAAERAVELQTRYNWKGKKG